MFFGARCTTVMLSPAAGQDAQQPLQIRGRVDYGGALQCPRHDAFVPRVRNDEPREQAILNEPPHFVSILGHQRRQSTPVLGTGFVEPLDPAQSLLEIRLEQVQPEAFARNERRGASGRCEDQLVRCHAADHLPQGEPNRDAKTLSSAAGER